MSAAIAPGQTAFDIHVKCPKCKSTDGAHGYYCIYYVHKSTDRQQGS